MGLKSKIAAIEIAEDEVRLAVIKMRAGKPSVLELLAERAEYAEPEERFDAMIRAMENVLARMKTSPSAFVLCVSSFFSVFRTLTIPFRGKRRVAAAVQFELEPYLAFPIEELVVDFCTVLEREGQTDVLVVGVRRAILEEQLAILSAAGIDPEGIDIDAMGLTELWKACCPPPKGLHAVLHVREEGAILAVINNKSLAYFRHLSFTARQIHENSAVAAREVQKSLRAFHTSWRGEGRIDSLTVTGARFFPEEQELFEGELDVPVFYETLIDKLRAPNRLNPPASTPEDVSQNDEAQSELEIPSNYWEAAIGVAMASSGRGNSLNFRRGELAWQNALSVIVPHVMLTSCLALLFLVGVAWYYHDGRNRNYNEIARIQAEIEVVQQEVFDLQEQGVNVSADIFRDPNLLDILREIGTRIPDEKASVTEMRIEPPGPSTAWITIRGDIKDDAVFGEIFSNLKQSDLFAVNEDPEREMIDGRSTFKITARRKNIGTL